MTQPIPPTDALDENERELARIVRALPGGEPPPALDARILKAAANAAAGSRRPRSRWLASSGAMWGIGGAAAAVLAFGVSWHTMFPSQRSGGPATSPVAVESGTRQDSTVSVEFKDREPRVFDNSPPPASPAAPARLAPSAPTAALARPVASAPPAPPPAMAVTNNAPEPFSLDHIDEHVGSRAAVAAAAQADAASAGAAQEMAGAAREQSSTSGMLAAKSDAMQAKTVAAAQDKTQPLRLSPKNWLAHVRQLRDQNQTAEARASLIAFHKRYPDMVIPSDLAPLLRE